MSLVAFSYSPLAVYELARSLITQNWKEISFLFSAKLKLFKPYSIEVLILSNQSSAILLFKFLLYEVYPISCAIL